MLVSIIRRLATTSLAGLTKILPAILNFQRVLAIGLLRLCVMMSSAPKTIVSTCTGMYGNAQSKKITTLAK